MKKKERGDDNYLCGDVKRDVILDELITQHNNHRQLLIVVLPFGIS